jgi:hypothetical protein
MALAPAYQMSLSGCRHKTLCTLINTSLHS